MTTLKSPSRDNMEIDTELVSPIRTHTRFSDRFKTLFQESPPQELTEAESVQKSPLVSYSSPKKAIAQEPKLIRTIIKNEDRGQWREASSPKRMEEKVVKEKEMITQETAPKETPVETKKAPKVTKSTKVSKIPAPSPSVSTTKSTPHYMMATTSFMSKFDSKKRRETLGVRSVGKISKRQTPSKIPRYNKQPQEDDTLKRLSFQGTYVPMASRVKSFERELRPLGPKSEEANHGSSRSSSPSPSIRSNAPKFKLFKFATSERAKKHHQQQKD